MQHLSKSKKRNKTRLSGKVILIAAAMLAIAAAVITMVFLRGKGSETTVESNVAEDGESVFLGISQSGASEDGENTVEEKTVCISEIMPKNRATLRDENGEFPDYIELINLSDETISLAGWRLSDERGKEEGWVFPDTEIAPGEYLLVFADGKNILSGQMHTDFAVSEGETVYLYDSSGNMADMMICTASQADTSCIRNADGETENTLYPSPGFPNTSEGYIEWQETLQIAGPLVISEVMTANYTTLRYKTEYPDWVEIKNISSAPVQLAGYYLSDTNKDLKKWRFPERELAAGSSIIVLCDPEIEASDEEMFLFADFSLNSQEEQLYLSDSSGLTDYVPLKDIPYGCSLGRTSGKNGFFYYSSPSPRKDNTGGYRYVASSPVCLTMQGVYEDTDSLEVELKGEGTVYYTLDGTVPTSESMLYSGPINITGTTVIRAVSVISGAMDSRPSTFSFFLNENCSLPVVSLVIDDIKAYNGACKRLDKTVDLPSNVALYEDGEVFNLGCTVKLTGQASLSEYKKKGMRVKFSGAFGQDKLSCDLFGNGVKDYYMLSLRTGNDNGKAYIRNELCQDLAYEFTDDLVNQHGKYCVVYINGEYWGIYCLKEKVNEQYIADCEGVSKGSLETVTLEDIRINSTRIPMYSEVFLFAMYNDLSIQANYDKIAELIDIDNFIDWYVVQGYTGNWDIFYRNVTFYRSSEGNGKWHIALYDLDHTFEYHEYAFYNTYRLNYEVSYMAQLMSRLLKNEEFRGKYLRRAATALTTVFTNENVLNKIDELEQEILPEIERDCSRWERPLKDYNYHMNRLKSFIVKNKVDYGAICRTAICTYLNLSEQEFLAYAEQ
ncbi:MAG: CotH kinase family protein [Oscillospiraceae bacterium]|nr:CotH kinase family protein [Oscillospiraceae bacterium]